MKKITALALLLTPLVAMSQDKVVTKKISLNLTEQYRVLADKDVRQGLYMVTDADGGALVRGKYDQGKKTGVWMFYGPNNQLVQQYDYTNSRMVYTNLDSGSYVQTDYSVSAPDKATVLPPVKIGGSTLAFLTFYNSKDIPPAITKEKSDISIKYTVNVEPTGQIADVYADYESNGTQEHKKLYVKANSSGLLDFIPAKVDGQPVKSTVILATTVGTDLIKVNYNNQIMNSQKN
ncbi:hypothetical protein EWM62_13885 [Mucilaginibacter terrigena]|uniref:DUF3108 domain-containing protein n=1 Tax=Mucilaginibacter terrigena TaxID=2492395 RepID=A0A4Q5LJ91_9SPHI|nr:hypothetical protein [Mucilaginibacter terrigena]RYU89413.1 hypothetical protein EWM62_13885 [Mucilaginibacter terrigena]